MVRPTERQLPCQHSITSHSGDLWAPLPAAMVLRPLAEACPSISQVPQGLHNLRVKRPSLTLNMLKSDASHAGKKAFIAGVADDQAGLAKLQCSR